MRMPCEHSHFLSLIAMTGFPPFREGLHFGTKFLPKGPIESFIISGADFIPILTVTLAKGEMSVFAVMDSPDNQENDHDKERCRQRSDVSFRSKVCRTFC